VIISPDHLILAGLDFISFASLMVIGRLEYVKFAMFLVGSGGILAMVCSRIGWSQTFLIDLLLNQVSVAIILLGQGIFALGKAVNPMGTYIFIFGIVLAALGMKFTSPIPLDEALKQKNLNDL